MARIEIAHLQDLKVEHANISDVVGIGGKNEKSDVMLIQALFALAGPNEFSARKFFGLARKDLPEPDGEINAKTVRAIWAFLTRMSYRLLNTDGKIHPATYQNRVIKRAFNGRLMAITLLNMEAEFSVAFNGNSIFSAVKQIAPSIVLTR